MQRAVRQGFSFSVQIMELNHTSTSILPTINYSVFVLSKHSRSASSISANSAHGKHSTWHSLLTNSFKVE